jgi:hypothetical protein
MKKVLIPAAAALLAVSSLAFAQDSVVIEVPQSVRDYVIANPSDPVVIDDELSQGYVVPEEVMIHEIPESPGYGYIYVDGRPIIVSLDNRQVVYLSDTEGPSSGGEFPDEVITYVEKHPSDPVVIEGDLATGAMVPADIPLAEVPDQPRYSYIYVDDRPALVETETRRIVWVR